MTETVDIADVIVDRKFQPRAKGLDEQHVRDLMEAYRQGKEIESPRVFRVERRGLILTQGFHRIEALKQLGKKKVLVEVRVGTEVHAILDAAGSNNTHGLKRTNEDKRRAVGMVLEIYPDWSNRAIAEMAGVSGAFVDGIRPTQLPTVGSSKRLGRDGKERALPKPKAEPQPVKQLTTTDNAKSTEVHSDDRERFEEIFAQSLTPQTEPHELPEPPDDTSILDVPEPPQHETCKIGSSYVRNDGIPDVPGVYRPRFVRTPDGVEVAYDAYGTPLNNSLGDVFADVRLRNIVADLHLAGEMLVRSQKEFSKLSAQSGDFTWLETVETVKLFNNAVKYGIGALDYFRDGIPYGQCPECHGKKCRVCRFTGYWPRRECLAQSEKFTERKL